MNKLSIEFSLETLHEALCCSQQQHMCILLNDQPVVSILGDPSN